MAGNTAPLLAKVTVALGPSVKLAPVSRPGWAVAVSTMPVQAAPQTFFVAVVISGDGGVLSSLSGSSRWLAGIAMGAHLEDLAEGIE